MAKNVLLIVTVYPAMLSIITMGVILLSVILLIVVAPFSQMKRLMIRQSTKTVLWE
jgi:hypothetical protein